MASRRLTFVALPLTLAACSGRQLAPIALSPGASPPIGFRVIEGADATRPFGDMTARPLRAGVWYPATQAQGHRLSLEEYGQRLSVRWAGAPTIHTGRLAAATDATLDAPLAATPRPLVLYLPGFGASATVHAVACERLAAHGYVVAAMASMGPTPAGMSFDLAGVEAQQRDAEWSVAAVESALGRRFSQIGLVAVSFGSLAGWRLLIGGDERMTALVSLDGSLGFVDGVELLTAHRPERPARQAVLHLNVLDNDDNDLSLLEAQPFALTQIVTTTGFDHSEFFPGMLLRSEPGGEVASVAGARLGFVLNVATRFLDAQFRRRRACVSVTAGASRCLAPRLEIPAESAATRLLASPAGRAELLALGRQAAALGVDEPLVREGLLDAVAAGAEAPAVVAVARLRTALFPRSYQAWWVLGEALSESGDVTGAIAAFETVKALNPKVRDADTQIAKLRQQHNLPAGGGR